MSYRLIDSNAIAIKYPEVNDMPCIFVDLSNGLDNDYHIIDAPIRHGRWIRDEFGSKCSVCGNYAYRDKFDKPWESPCCPKCGAKLDEVEG